MAVFKDITGWREELEELRKGPAYKKMYPEVIRNPKDDPLVPLSVILDFVETLLAHEETKEGLLAPERWRKNNPPTVIGRNTYFPDPENDPTFPHAASNLVEDFKNWFMLKTGYGPRFPPYFTGMGLATKVLNGEIPGVRSPEAEDYLRSVTKNDIDFDC